ncbi:MAG: STAS domain-containing protein [Bacteroidia bacterium]|nr:STAS domain-containing protein [Bacteroidia bacterium]
MNIHKESHDDCDYVTLIPEGELDANSSVFLDEKVREIIDAKTYNIHVEMGRIEYISSAGLGVFISYVEELSSHNGKFVLTKLPENVKEVFTILGLHQLDNLVLVEDDGDPCTYFKESE